jgi:histidinol dehydrogenase
MFRSIMITFKQFLEEAKKKDKKPKPLYSEKHINKILNKQGGIGGKAVEKYNEKNPNRGPREYKLGEDVQQKQQQLNQTQRERLQAEKERVARYKAKRQADADREDEQDEIIKRIEITTKNNK